MQDVVENGAKQPMISEAAKDVNAKKEMELLNRPLGDTQFVGKAVAV